MGLTQWRVIEVLRERRVLQFLSVYAVSGFVALEVVDQFVGRAILPDLAYVLVLIILPRGYSRHPDRCLVPWREGTAGAARRRELGGGS